MRHASRFQRALAALALLVLAVPLLAFGARTVILFSTGFDVASGAPGSGPTFVAEGGIVELAGPPDVFVPTLDASGDGVLKVLPNPTPVAAHLDAVLATPFKGSQIDIDYSTSHGGNWSKIVLTALDDDDDTMIDIESGDDGGGGGTLDVGDIQIPYPASTTGTYQVRVSLREPSYGPASWTVTITSTNGPTTTTSSASGTLGPPGAKLSLSRIVFERPAGAVGGTYEIDDLVVSSPIQSLGFSN